MGLPTRAARSMRPWQVRSADAILKAGTSSEAEQVHGLVVERRRERGQPDVLRVPEQRLEVAVARACRGLSKVSHCVPLGSGGSTQ